MESQELMNILNKINEEMATKEDIDAIKLGNEILQSHMTQIKRSSVRNTWR